MNKLTKTAQDYAVKLHELGIPRDILQQTSDIFHVVEQIGNDLKNPSISLEKKIAEIRFMKSIKA